MFRFSEEPKGLDLMQYQMLLCISSDAKEKTVDIISIVAGS